jgi:hypothetical protein
VLGHGSWPRAGRFTRDHRRSVESFCPHTITGGTRGSGLADGGQVVLWSATLCCPFRGCVVMKRRPRSAEPINHEPSTGSNLCVHAASQYYYDYNPHPPTPNYNPSLTLHLSLLNLLSNAYNSHYTLFLDTYFHDTLLPCYCFFHFSLPTPPLFILLYHYILHLRATRPTPGSAACPCPGLTELALVHKARRFPWWPAPIPLHPIL